MVEFSEFRVQYTVHSGSTRIMVHATAEIDQHRPVAVLVHGTGYLAHVWSDIVPHLAKTYTVVAYDRRGHGRSDQPDDAYDFPDYANDLCAVLDAFAITGVFGIAHSVGATDMLLGAAQRPDAFARIFAVEPTVMLPRLDSAELPLGDLARQTLESVRRRRATFASVAEARSRLAAAPAYSGWQGRAFEACLTHGLLPADKDRVRLRLDPATEATMLLPIFRVMEQTYNRPHIFSALSTLDMPVRIVSCDRSEFVYPPMVKAAMELIPNATNINFATGHCVAQQDPDGFATAVLEFAND